MTTATARFWMLAVLLALLLCEKEISAFPSSTKQRTGFAAPTLNKRRTRLSASVQQHQHEKQLKKHKDGLVSSNDAIDRNLGTPTILTSSTTTAESNYAVSATSTVAVTSHPTDSSATSLFQGMDAKAVLVSCLAFISGAADVISFRRFGVYTNMMTGNTLRICFAIGEMELSNIIFHSTVVLSYLAGVALFRRLQIEQQQKLPVAGRSQPFNHASLWKWVVLIFAGGEFVASRLLLPERCHALVWSLGFGLVNAAAFDATSTITNAATGHLNKVGMGMVDVAVLGQTPAAVPTSRRFLASFTAGALVTSVIVPKLPAAFVTGGLGTLVGIGSAALFRWYGRHQQRTSPSRGSRSKTQVPPVASSTSTSSPLSTWAPVVRMVPFQGLERNGKHSRP